MSPDHTIAGRKVWGTSSPIGIMLLIMFLVAALFVCHGAFGAYHSLPGSQTAVMEVGPGQQNAAAADKGLAICPTDEGYFVVFPAVLLLGVALALLLRIGRPWPCNVRLAFTAARSRLPVSCLARGGSHRIALQVFRL